MLHNYLIMFKKRENIVEIEEGKFLSPKFDNDGLIPVITMCSKTKDVLMHGSMNLEAFKKTIETEEAHYFSRSRQQIWHKGKKAKMAKATPASTNSKSPLIGPIPKASAQAERPGITVPTQPCSTPFKLRPITDKQIKIIKRVKTSPPQIAMKRAACVAKFLM